MVRGGDQERERRRPIGERAVEVKGGDGRTARRQVPVVVSSVDRSATTAGTSCEPHRSLERLPAAHDVAPVRVASPRAASSSVSPHCSSVRSGRSAGRSAAARRAGAPASPPRQRPARGTTRLASPMASASAPDTARPVRTRSRARPCPMMRGSRTVPRSTAAPRSGGRTRRGPQSWPPPACRTRWRAEPAGDGVPLDGGDHRLGQRKASPPSARTPVGAGRRSPAVTACRSAPAQAVRRRGQHPHRARVWSASKASKASRRPVGADLSTALRRSGRSMVTSVAGPCAPRGARGPVGRGPRRGSAAVRG